jgi:NADH:ubiquinone oxidoreductase subunit 6 (subunit J)
MHACCLPVLLLQPPGDLRLLVTMLVGAVMVVLLLAMALHLRLMKQQQQRWQWQQRQQAQQRWQQLRVLQMAP